MDAQIGKSLRDIYAANDDARAVLDIMRTYVKGVWSIKTHMMEHHLWNADSALTHAQVIAVFRKFEQIGIGKYVEGRRGGRSRFELVDRITVIAKLIVEKNIEDIDYDALDLEDDAVSMISDMTTHVLLLRSGLNIEIELPSDLTQREADRLSRFVSCLAIDAE